MTYGRLNKPPTGESTIPRGAIGMAMRAVTAVCIINAGDKMAHKTSHFRMFMFQSYLDFRKLVPYSK
jgi:urease beta subunit